MWGEGVEGWFTSWENRPVGLKISAVSLKTIHWEMLMESFWIFWETFFSVRDRFISLRDRLKSSIHLHELMNSLTSIKFLLRKHTLQPSDRVSCEFASVANEVCITLHMAGLYSRNQSVSFWVDTLPQQKQICTLLFAALKFLTF